MPIEIAKPNTVGLITQTEDGRIIQLGLSQSQSDALQLFVAAMSKEKPIVSLGIHYELEFKNRR